MRAAVITFVLFFMAACQLESDAPLLDSATSQKIYGDRFFILAENKTGGVQLDKRGKATVAELRFKNGVYSEYPADPASGFLISFHPIKYLNDFHILQFVPKKADSSTIYLVSRVAADAISFSSIDLDNTTLAALKNSGTIIEKSGSNYKVTSQDQLNEVIRLWSQINLQKLESLGAGGKNTDGRFLVDIETGDGLRARAIAAECLALAGHGEDPAVQKLDKTWRSGKPIAEIDTERALPVCQAAARKEGSASVRYALARVHEANKDYHLAEQLLPDLIADDFPLAYVLGAEHLVYGNGVTKNPAAARTLLTDPASRKLAMPAYLLGIYELNGTLGKADPVAAKRWLGIAADKGVSEAQYQLGMLISRDPQNAAEAYKYFRNAADQGHAQGAYQAGYALYFGNGVKGDQKGAYRDLHAAAKQDVAWAQYFVGFMQARGQGTTKNEKKAVEWFRKAHDADVLPATGELGRALYYGLGVTADKAEGRKLLKSAAEQGDKNAATYLAAIKSAASKTPAQTYNVPNDRADDVNRLAAGKPFNLTEQNLPFMTGLASDLMERCGAPSDDFALRTELAAFIASSSLGNIMGFDYSNPNLGEMMGSMGRSQAAMVAGVMFGRQLSCGAVANQFAGGIAKALRSNAQGADGGLSVFVKTCTPHFDQRRCSCLANIGRQAIPNIHRQSYNRRLIKQIIERNPFLGFQIGIACQIGNY
ncbi:sel1 repeat family protein [Aliiroseovarius sp. Z3]|uniref:tetratricopeptide repeat protein n=1 Tax=Aliiroseovarius sp. Z3 TaxID=2811402 RepID=UPI0023B22D8A|nr:tetratricopeptide repeat protein [Aliiroseovarius sp. Z3]MDE9451673.1 sel1 repeat family protein [Aliiroseovarius sp. Z3]